MKLIIDISENIYNTIMQDVMPNEGQMSAIITRLYQGTPYEERPQGEWIEKVERRGCFAGDKTVYSYTCPFCGVKEFKKYPFCHCGADMREAEK